VLALPILIPIKEPRLQLREPESTIDFLLDLRLDDPIVVWLVE
jgi:hypothetical protein